MSRRKSGVSRVLKPIQTAKVDGEENVVVGEPLSPISRVLHEPGSNLHLVITLGWKSKVHHDVLKSNLMPDLLKHRRLSSLQVGNKENGEEIRWVQTDVDVDDHFIVPDLDHKMESPNKFVEDYISNLSNTRFDMSKPMWDFHHLNVKTSDAEAVSILRVHHSIGDGMSMMSLLLACSRKASDPNALPTIPVTKRSNVTHSRGLLSVFNMIWSNLIAIIAYFLKDTETPLKGPLGVGSNPRRFVHRILSLDDIKLVKNSINTTINDVVVGVTQAALSRYLNRRYGEGKSDPKKKNYLPKDIRFRALVFFNIRRSAKIHDLVDMMEKGKDGRWGNKTGYVLLPLSIAFQDDPLDYVREAKVVMDSKKASVEPNYAYFVAKFVSKFFGSKAAGALSRRVFSIATMWFSNVAGPREEITLCGHPLAYIAPSCYGQSSALLIHAMSYADKLTFILSVDEETIPDPHQLCDDLEESLNLMKNAVFEDRVKNA
ncbi:wax ester synthase/diacylglycerol acyltransferase 11-like [Cornus florida]|uniref:wax ester synthase/diacylglycerol acyltransferase 11-like n=1 Tax=Cornus florida TaxID=4283 RepID=UPI00289B9C99|nr:wax ester synthase/diacylglycerol acyltransferase 11-like [Cornus florida]